MLIEPGQFISRKWQRETYLVFVLETTLDYIKGIVVMDYHSPESVGSEAILIDEVEVVIPVQDSAVYHALAVRAEHLRDYRKMYHNARTSFLEIYKGNYL